MTPFSLLNNLPIAKLCRECKEAALFDDSQNFLRKDRTPDGTTRLVASEHTAIRTSRIQHLQDDALPSLPLLLDSAERGCDFCAFLRIIILCDDTQDEIQRVFGSGGTDADPLEVSISIHFRWKYRHENDVRGDGLLGAAILLCFDDGKIEITLFCLAEGISGHHDPFSFYRRRPVLS